MVGAFAKQLLCLYRWLFGNQLADTFQAGLMIFALLLLPIVTYMSLGVGVEEFTAIVESARPRL